MADVLYYRLKANAFLQSPFLVSRRVLKYVLAYHIVPDLSFYTDFISNSSSVYQIGSSTFDQSNVTHYELPTLLSKSGVNKNATLLVDVVSYKSLGGRGPIRRDIIVRPHEVEDRPDASSMDASPVRVYKADLVARHGAIHVRPPHYLISFSCSCGCVCQTVSYRDQVTDSFFLL